MRGTVLRSKVTLLQKRGRSFIDESVEQFVQEKDNFLFYFYNSIIGE